MKAYLTAATVCFGVAAIALAVLISGCFGTKATMYRDSGYNSEATALYHTPGEPFGCKSVVLDRVEIYFCDEQSMPPCGSVKNPAGCAGGNTLRVLAKKTPDGYVTSWSLIGHELMHLLHWKDGAIVDPDRYGEFGY